MIEIAVVGRRILADPGNEGREVQTMRVMKLFLAVILAAAGCEEGGNSTPPTNCNSGSAWSGGNEESPLMNPGQDCIACHTSEGEGPRFSIAGTVMGASNDDDNCNGLSGARVQITGSDGQMIELTTNAAGNFFAREGQASIALPYKAVVIGPTGKTNAMSAAQSTGSCNSCHTAAGANGAPGRITVPN